MDKGYPKFDGSESDEAEVGFLGFVVAGGDPAPVLQFVEQPLDQVAPAVFRAVMRGRRAAVGFGGDHRFQAGGSDLVADGIGIVAAIGKERFDPIIDHPEQRSEALHIVCLAGCQHEAERKAPGIAPGVEFGGEAAARPAEPLCLLSPLFMPTAQ